MTAPIYFVRHGETEWNRTGRIQGRHDSPLTPEGRAQASRNAIILARELPPPRRLPLVSSPLGRAKTTAAILADALGLAVTCDRRLAEVSVGAWEGMTRDEIEAEFGSALEGVPRCELFFHAPGGERFAAAGRRLARWLTAVERPCIAIGHGIAGRLLRGLHADLGREATLSLPVRRDGVFKLADGTIDFLAAGAA